MSGKIRGGTIEIGKETNKINGKYNFQVYGQKEGDTYIFTDLRTLVDFSKLKHKDNYDFTKKEYSAVERQVFYILSDSAFDLDYSLTARKKYEFGPMRNLYAVLWDIENNKILNSAETLVSPNQSITRWKRGTKKAQRGRNVVDWKNFFTIYEAFSEIEKTDIEEFTYSLATIGNYMPVPSAEQILLNRNNERFDILLNKIKLYFEKDAKDNHFTQEIMEWLNSFDPMDGNNFWENFVEKNYLKGSFVDVNYEVVMFDNSIRQLSEMITNRSIVMLEEYKARVEKNLKLEE